MNISNDLLGTLDHLQQRIKTLCNSVPQNERIVIALAGIPGSGKSTIAAALLEQLHHVGMKDVAIVPMDGYHLSKARLATMSDPAEAFRRRGAPFTFDADTFVATVETLRNTTVTIEEDSSQALRLPSFDHAVQDPVANDILVRSTTKVVILEGNYTLLNVVPWNNIARLVDEKWFVDIPREKAKGRLTKRHLLAGIETTVQAAEERAESNDLPNGDYIVTHMVEPDVRIYC